MEWIEYQASLCSGCGSPRSESFDPSMEFAYEAMPFQCFACATRDAESRKASTARSKGDFTDASFDGLYFAVQPREV